MNGSREGDDRARRARASGHRRVRLGDRPTVTLVVCSVSTRPELERQLAALAPRCAALGAELVVARGDEPANVEALGQNWPTVRFVACAPGTGRFGLREAGMARADGDIVTLMDDDAGDAAARMDHLEILAREPRPNGADEEVSVALPDGPRVVDRLKPGDHVVIVGAGPGGLTPAYILAKKGVRVTVLEAEDIVGGISQTAQYKGYRFDIGGHRFFTKIKPVDDLWHEILGDEFISVPRLSRIHYNGTFFDYPLKAGNALRGLGLWNAITIVISYIWAHIRPSPVEENFEQWVTNRFGRKLYEIFFKTYTEKVWGIPCTEIRAEWAAQRIQNLSLARAILSAAQVNRRSTAIKTLIHEFKYPRLGPGQMWEMCAQKVEAMGGRVLMQHRVTALETRDGRVRAVRARTAGGETVRIEGDHFISTMPIRNLVGCVPDALAMVALLRERFGLDPQRIRLLTSPVVDGAAARANRAAIIAGFRDFLAAATAGEEVLFYYSGHGSTTSLDPAPPARVRAAGKSLSYRDFLVVALIMDTEDLFPDNWIYIHSPGVQVGRIQNFNNWSRAMVPDAGRTCLGLEYFCFEGDGLWTSDDADLIDLATRELDELGLAGGARVLDGTVVRMPKAYPVYDSTYREHLDVVRSFLDPIPNLHLVGRNGMHKYNNQDHSMLTAMMAVWNMEGAEHDVWAVNTDFEYHEEQRVAEPETEAERSPVAASG